MKYLNLFLWYLRATLWSSTVLCRSWEDLALIQKDASVEVRVFGLLGHCLLPYTFAR